MKVLSHPPEFKNFKITCDGCAAELEIEKKDLMYYIGDQRDPSYFYITCILCNTQRQIPQQSIPVIDRKNIQKVSLHMRTKGGTPYDR
jgi:RNase P subunit RPR2